MRATTASRLFGIRVQIDACRLPGAYASDLSFRDEAAQIHLTRIQQRDKRRTRRNHFARFSRACSDDAIEGRKNIQVAAMISAEAAGIGAVVLNSG